MTPRQVRALLARRERELWQHDATLAYAVGLLLAPYMKLGETLSIFELMPWLKTPEIARELEDAAAARVRALFEGLAARGRGGEE